MTVRTGDICESGLPRHETHFAYGAREGVRLCEICCFDWEMAHLHDGEGAA